MQNQNEFPLPDSLAAGRCVKKEGGGSEGGKGRRGVVEELTSGAHVRLVSALTPSHKQPLANCAWPEITHALR